MSSLPANRRLSFSGTWMRRVVPPAVTAAALLAAMPGITAGQSGWKWFGNSQPVAPPLPQPQNGFSQAVQKLLDQARDQASAGDFTAAMKSAERAHKIADAAAGVLGEDPYCSPAMTRKFLQDLTALAAVHAESPIPLAAATSTPATPLPSRSRVAPTLAAVPAGSPAALPVASPSASSRVSSTVAPTGQPRVVMAPPQQPAPMAVRTSPVPVRPTSPTPSTSPLLDRTTRNPASLMAAAPAQTPAAVAVPIPAGSSPAAPTAAVATAVRPSAAIPAAIPAPVAPQSGSQASAQRREWLAFLQTAPAVPAAPANTATAGTPAADTTNEPATATATTIAVAPHVTLAPGSGGAARESLPDSVETTASLASMTAASPSTPKATVVAQVGTLTKSDLTENVNQPYLGLTEFAILGGNPEAEVVLQLRVGEQLKWSEETAWTETGATATLVQQHNGEPSMDQSRAGHEPRQWSAQSRLIGGPVWQPPTAMPEVAAIPPSPAPIPANNSAASPTIPIAVVPSSLAADNPSPSPSVAKSTNHSVVEKETTSAAASAAPSSRLPREEPVPVAGFFDTMFEIDAVDNLESDTTNLSRMDLPESDSRGNDSRGSEQTAIRVSAPAAREVAQLPQPSREQFPQKLSVENLQSDSLKSAESAIFAVDTALLVVEPSPNQSAANIPAAADPKLPQSLTHRSSFTPSEPTQLGPAPTEWSSAEQTPSRNSAKTTSFEQHSPWQPARRPSSDSATEAPSAAVPELESTSTRNINSAPDTNSESAVVQTSLLVPSRAAVAPPPPSLTEHFEHAGSAALEAEPVISRQPAVWWQSPTAADLTSDAAAGIAMNSGDTGSATTEDQRSRTRLGWLLSAVSLLVLGCGWSYSRRTGATSNPSPSSDAV